MFRRKSKPYHHAWAMYDWANSAYNLVITSTIFPAYYTAVTTIKENGVIVKDTVDFFGLQIKNSALFEYALGFAYLVIALLSPLLSSIADFKGNKKTFMSLFIFIGSVSCCLLFFTTGENMQWGIILFALAALGYTGSIVFYNSFLPQIAVREDRDRLSAKGFSLGYLGSVLLQIICLVLVLNDKWFADKSFPARFSFLLVGLWWMGFSLIPLIQLPKGQALKKSRHNILKGGLHELKMVTQQVKKMPVLKRYLCAFFFYSTGVQTVMLAATIFGSKELKLETDQLIITILVIQMVAIIGATSMSWLSGKIGNLKVLLLTVFIWILICVSAYFVYTTTQFYFLAAVVGWVMGGIQSLSRSTYSKLMPETQDTTSFFSFYDVVEKLAIVVGMFTFAFIDERYGMRQSIIALVLYFVIGAILLFYTLRTQKKLS